MISFEQHMNFLKKYGLCRMCTMKKAQKDKELCESCEGVNEHYKKQRNGTTKNL